MCNISFFLALILCYILLLTLWFLSSNFLGSYLIYFFFNAELSCKPKTWKHVPDKWLFFFYLFP